MKYAFLKVFVSFFLATCLLAISLPNMSIFVCYSILYGLILWIGLNRLLYIHRLKGYPERRGRDVVGIHCTDEKESIKKPISVPLSSSFVENDGSPLQDETELLHH